MSETNPDREAGFIDFWQRSTSMSLWDGKPLKTLTVHSYKDVCRTAYEAGWIDAEIRHAEAIALERVMRERQPQWPSA